jgi:hypothetical protein
MDNGFLIYSSLLMEQKHVQRCPSMSTFTLHASTPTLHAATLRCMQAKKEISFLHENGKFKQKTSRPVRDQFQTFKFATFPTKLTSLYYPNLRFEIFRILCLILSQQSSLKTKALA